MRNVVAGLLQVVGVTLVAVAIGSVWLPGAGLVTGAAAFLAGWTLEHGRR